MAINDSIKNDIFNVCSGKELTIQNLADMISPNQIYIPRTYGEVEHIHGITLN